MTAYIHTSHSTCINVLSSKKRECLESIGDSGWHVLTDFRNWSVWFPGISSAESINSDAPARGSQLQVCCQGIVQPWTIELWDPPQGIQFSTKLKEGGIAYAFSITTDHRKPQLVISLEIESKPSGITRLFPVFARWQQQQKGQRLISSLGERIRATKNL